MVCASHCTDARQESLFSDAKAECDLLLNLSSIGHHRQVPMSCYLSTRTVGDVHASLVCILSCVLLFGTQSTQLPVHDSGGPIWIEWARG